MEDETQDLGLESDEDTQTLEESDSQTDTISDDAGAEDVEALQKRNEELEAKNKVLFARAKKAEAKPKPASNKQETDDFDVTSAVKELQLEKHKSKFAYEHGLSPEQADFVFRQNSNPSKETLDDVAIKGALSALGAKQRVDSATPSASGRSASFSPSKMKDLSPEEQDKNFKKFLAERTKK